MHLFFHLNSCRWTWLQIVEEALWYIYNVLFFIALLNLITYRHHGLELDIFEANKYVLELYWAGLEQITDA